MKIACLVFSSSPENWRVEEVIRERERGERERERGDRRKVVFLKQNVSSAFPEITSKNAVALNAVQNGRQTL